MVKGTTRQVIVVKRPDQKLFDEAIFLVRDDVLMNGGVTEEALLQEAREVCKTPSSHKTWLQQLLWSIYGAAGMGIIWIISAIIQL